METNDRDEIPRILDELRFIQEYKLAARAHKGTWRKHKVRDLFFDMLKEVLELHEQLTAKKLNESDAILECGDIANYCAFIADKLRRGEP
jgi:hypothetical protein